MACLKSNLFLACAALFSQALCAQTAVVADAQPSAASVLVEATTRVPDEIGRIFRYPLDEPDNFKKYALGIGLLVLLDKPLTTFYQKNIESPLSGFRVSDPPKIFPKVIGSGTDGWLLLGISGTYLGGLVAGDVHAQKTGIAAAKATAYSYVISHLLLKTLTGRSRPNPALGVSPPTAPYTDNPYDWGNFHGVSVNQAQRGTSFPSFHFTAFFAAAKVYQESYDNYLVPYSLLTVGLVSNIKGHQHWVSDMAAGALIGTLIGSSVSKDYFGEKSNFKLQPTLSQGGGGLLLSYKY